MDHLRCVVQRITYHNDENGYIVIKCSAKGYSELVTCVGTMPNPNVGSVLSLEGYWKVDARYGRQFTILKYEETLPATVYGIEKYLGSGMIKGIGPKFARKIVDHFGTDTLNVIEETPERLNEVEGIGPVRAERIITSWQDQKEIRNVMLFLQDHNVSTQYAAKIYKTYGNDSIKVIQENPYKLADDVWGIGFKTADTIAMSLGMEKNKYVRLRSGILYTMNKLSEKGHCFALRDQLIHTAEELLETDHAELEITLDEMLRSKDLIREDEAIYLQPFYFAESGCAKLLLKLIDTKPQKTWDVDSLISYTLTMLDNTSGIIYDPVQIEAIHMALTNKVIVMTGGPGTGKTTTVRGMITAFGAAGCRILLAAPTGRAAKRLEESSGMEAKTIHRLLEYQPQEGYKRNEENPLEGDVLILDECSMIDILLMYNLLKAVPSSMHVILVGDTDQLQSVGPGNVLKDIISSGKIPVVQLTHIFRQAQGSRIIMNAHRIRRGEALDLRGGKASDFFFAERNTNEEIVDTLVQFVTKKLPAYYHINALQDIQVLTPMQRGICGASNLNQVLQKTLNPETSSLKHGGVEYRLHDRVMQIRNNYEKEIFNGDIGIITRVDLEEHELTVTFDDRLIGYDITELDELTLAYAATVHKAQGSEYPVVIVPITMSHYVMLQRNLLYTAVTRAKKILVLVGQKKALSYAIHNETTSVRNTRLSLRLKQETK